MDIDYTARRMARAATASTEALSREFASLKESFSKALERVAQLEDQVRQLQDELAPKTLDKPGPFEP